MRARLRATTEAGFIDGPQANAIKAARALSGRLRIVGRSLILEERRKRRGGMRPLSLDLRKRARDPLGKRCASAGALCR